jgi:hypothetical protein
VLDVLHLDQHRLFRGGDPHAHRFERPLDTPLDDRLLLAVLDAVQQLLAQVVVDGGVGAAPGGPRQRHRLGARAVAAHEQLGAGPHERQLGGADAPAEAGREGLPQGAEHGGGIVRRGGVRTHLAREDDLLELPGADALHRALDGLLVVRRRRGAGHSGGLDRVRVEQGHGRRLELARPRKRILHEGVRRLVAVGNQGYGQARLASVASERNLRKHQ